VNSLGVGGIKANEDQDFCFCGGSEKSRFKWIHKELF